MTDTLIDVPVDRQRIARPEGGPRAPWGRRARSSATPTAWQAAKTVLVAQPVGPRQLVTIPRLVIPIGENQLAFGVSSHSAEADHLAYDGRVIVQPGDWRGNPALGSHQRQGHAQLVTAGTLLPYVQSEIDAKYRWRTSLARLFHRLARADAPYGDAVVLVTVNEPSPVPLPHSPLR